RGRDEPFEIAGHGHVTADGETAEPLRLLLERVAATSEHGDVRAALGESLGDTETDARGGAADDGGPALEREGHAYFLFRTPTTSRTAAAEALNIERSSAVSFSLTTSSTPAAPSFAGTPMYRPRTPYSPSRYAVHGSTRF